MSRRGQVQITDRVFILVAARGIQYVVVLPEPLSFERVTAAWSYAVRYSAKGLDLPDYDAAVKLLSDRHPSWQVIQSQCIQVAYNGAMAEQDIPETR